MGLAIPTYAVYSSTTVDCLLIVSVDTKATFVPSLAASRLPNRTVVVPGSDGDGIISLEVFHQLHCLVCRTKFLVASCF